MATAKAWGCEPPLVAAIDPTGTSHLSRQTRHTQAIEELTLTGLLSDVHGHVHVHRPEDPCTTRAPSREEEKEGVLGPRTTESDQDSGHVSTGPNNKVLLHLRSPPVPPPQTFLGDAAATYAAFQLSVVYENGRSARDSHRPNQIGRDNEGGQGKLQQANNRPRLHPRVWMTG
ncbi:hypothetical protein B0T17DRAFT_505090 [Bombardia bombarda]|uniref:Uncharacterized protein n=1 Tax=Bombardia bombarda TaxID=252184 RepID=A0AA40C823_9PEZI|nr:hypothetical protein B0T17DRAFT_505090 [Bombardia bombarda]